jgi:alkylated DNA repair dioxygenase AlkB
MSSSKKRQQLSLNTFLGRHHNKPSDKCKRLKTRTKDGSHFGSCPLCNRSLPLHQLELHASSCNGDERDKSTTNNKPERAVAAISRTNGLSLQPTSEPIPGLFLFENFITEGEESAILAELDGETHQELFLPWTVSRFNGTHLGKRWGVHCNLKDKRVDAAENPLPSFVYNLLMPKLQTQLLQGILKGSRPNEANAISYHRDKGHYLAAHVDDRKLSKEPILNLSLAGDCYMTFQNVAPNRNTALQRKRVLLKRRCLQILTSKARYDFSHGIENQGLLSERRVSVTMRESPLTQQSSMNLDQRQLSYQRWWKNTMISSCETKVENEITPSLEPVPGLFVFLDFISEKEERTILDEMDGHKTNPWWIEKHTGTHRQKRWGIDHDLWSQALRPPRHELPDFMNVILIPRLKRVAAMTGHIPNEVNAIEYRRSLGHSLASHIDDRHKHKEPYKNCQTRRNSALSEKKVYLPRRCLQIITGNARYDFSHGIQNSDLISERRVSVTMRETPYSGR